MSGIIKLNEARLILEQKLSKRIQKLIKNLDYKRLHIVLNDGIEIYIVYNDYNEYNYSVLFSKIDLDRCRFDNFDKLWDVTSNPHHLHPRMKKEAISSKMTGNPKEDMPYLCNLIKSGDLSSIN